MQPCIECRAADKKLLYSLVSLCNQHFIHLLKSTEKDEGSKVAEGRVRKAYIKGIAFFWINTNTEYI